MKDIYAVHYSTHSLLRESKRYQLTSDEIDKIKEYDQHKIPDAEAATVPIVFSTAYHTLINLANLQQGQIVLIHAAAGGLGLAAIQIAKMRGARIFATAGNEKKRQYLRDLGCEQVWNSRNLELSMGLNR